MKDLRKTFIYRVVYLKFKYLLSFLFRTKKIVRNKIVFDNFNGKGYGCDPKYICEELRKRGGYDLVWLAKQRPESLPKDVRFVKYASIKAYQEMSTARVWVDNVKTSVKPKKRIGQFYIQTWHSSLGLKMNEGDAVETLTKEYIKMAKKDAAVTDLMYSNSDFRANKYRTKFWYSGPVISCGHPRCTPIIYPQTGIREKVDAYFGIQGKKIVLYAPTFRKDYRLDWYKFNYEGCMKVLEEKFGGEFVFLLRLHPNAAILCGDLNYNSRVIQASNYDDIQELLSAADVLITDYSGCMFDFSFAKKPVFLYTPDLEQYTSVDRKLYFKISELPFPVCECENKLNTAIMQYDHTSYSSRCDKFFQDIGLHEDGYGAVRIADIIENVCAGKGDILDDK